jgi:hypothetical protein
MVTLFTNVSGINIFISTTMVTLFTNVTDVTVDIYPTTITFFTTLLTSWATISFSRKNLALEAVSQSLSKMVI